LAVEFAARTYRSDPIAESRRISAELNLQRLTTNHTSWELKKR
jgi:hypothetical protein